MRLLRQSLRQVAIAWLLIQAVSLSALVGFDCCATHRAVKQEPKATQAAERSPCPMHAASTRSNVEQTSNQQDPGKCVMRGTCKGPLAALFAFLSNHGVPSTWVTATPDLDVTAVPNSSPEIFVVHFESPDHPPPRV